MLGSALVTENGARRISLFASSLAATVIALAMPFMLRWGSAMSRYASRPLASFAASSNLFFDAANFSSSAYHLSEPS